MRLPAALAALALALPAVAAEWTSIVRSPDFDLELDLGNAVRDGEVARAWDRTLYRADQGGPGSGDIVFRSAKTLMRYDCVRRTVVPLVRVFARADGAEIQRLYLEGAELPQPVVPDTPRERMLTLACKARAMPVALPAIKTPVAPADGTPMPPEAGKPARAEPARAAKPAPKAEAKPDAKTEAKTEAKPEGKEDAKPAPKEAARSEAEAGKKAEAAPGKPAAPAPAGPQAKAAAARPAENADAHGKPAAKAGAPAKSDPHAGAAGHGKADPHAKAGKEEPQDGEPAKEKEKPAQHVHWTYTGASGAPNWAKLAPEFAACATGKRQSPIDIKDGVRVQLEGVKFDYKPSALKVINNGHTVQVAYDPGSTISIGGTTYELVQFHFHRPAEERVAGRPFDMVAHLVHKSKEGQLAVVAVLMMPGDENAFIRTVWNNLPLDVGLDEAPPGVTIDANQLLPKLRGFYTYMGSLTTPPCTEGVRWIVLRTPVQVSRAQLATFGRLYEMNARPIQPANGRLIKEVF